MLLRSSCSPGLIYSSNPIFIICAGTSKRFVFMRGDCQAICLSLRVRSVCCSAARSLSPQIFLVIYFKNTKNLFIHIALIPEGDNPRVHPNILKCLLHSPVAKGYRLVVIASRAMVCKTPTYYLILYPLAFARGCVILRSHILFPLLLIFLISHHI